MEGIEIPDEERTSAWVDAMEGGDEVAIMRGGIVVAEVKPVAVPQTPRPVFDRVKLAALHAKLSPMAGGDVTQLVRDMRDADDH